MALSDTARLMATYFRQQGYSPAGIAAMLGNFQHESADRRINTRENTGDGGTAFGAAQWRLDRQAELRRLAAQRGVAPTDPTHQAFFTDHELRRDYPTLRKNLMTGTDPGALSTAFARQFERPSLKFAGFDARANYARQNLAALGGMFSGTPAAQQPQMGGAAPAPAPSAAGAPPAPAPQADASLLNPTPTAQAPTQFTAPQMIGTPNVVQTVPADLASMFVAQQNEAARRQQEAERQTAESQRKAALFGGDLFGPFA